jgi:glycerate 2-kinase
MRVQREMRDNDTPICVLAGGETTVTVVGNGRGGRNQELVLGAALALGSTTGITVASAGTDGVDGTTDAAGAIADSGTVRRAASAAVNAVHALENNDSYSVFSAAGDTFITGPTGTNVLDVQLALIAPPTAD